MWEYDTTYAKALVYFKRAQSHSNVKDEEFLIWTLLGLEFLLRAPLAKIHGSLLADPNGDALLHATGVPVGSDVNLKSVTLTTVLKRLPRIIPDFNQDRVDETNFLLNIRNAELHSDSAIASNVRHQIWLPKLVRIADVIANHLGVLLEDVLGEEIMDEGRSLVDAEDKALQNEVRKRIDQAKTFFNSLSQDDIKFRLANRPQLDNFVKTEQCPGCHIEIGVFSKDVRFTSERVEEDAVVSDVISVITELDCPICQLKLTNTAEIHAAGLEQQFERENRQSFEERFMGDYDEGYEYGND